MARTTVSALAAFVLLSPVIRATEPPAVTVREAIQLALDRHPEVAKALAASDALKGRIREVRALALPEISLGSSALRMRDPSLLNASGLDKFPEELRNALVPSGVNLFDYSLTIKQPIYTAGKVGTALRLASIESEGATIEVDRARQDLALAVMKACYALLWSERNLAVVRETQEQKKLHAAMARTRYKNGVATQVDMLRSEVAVANGAPDVVRAQNAIRQARAAVNYYLVRPIDFPTHIAGEFEESPPEETPLDDLLREATRRRPELSRLRMAERSAATQIDLARAENRMQVDFSSGYGMSARLPENLVNSKFARWNVALNFKLPVFDGFRRSGLVWQATANERAARLEREKTEQQIRLAVQQALDELKTAQETVNAARANIEQAERVLAMTQNNYKYGAATTLDITDAQTALSVARTNLLRGLHDCSVARANLRWAIGRTPWEEP
jgi:outer membrane protein TolC